MLQRKERRWLYLTLDEVKAIGAQMNTESVWHEELKNPMMVTSTRLAGTKMQFDFDDGTVFCYDFKDERHLAWETSDGRKGEEIYNSSPAPGYENIIFVHHYCSLEVPACVDLVMDFDSEDDLNEYLKTEPYMTGDVWKDISIEDCNVLYGNK